MKTTTLGAVVTVAMAGCAGSTDVVTTGPDTYMVASHGTTEGSSGSTQKAKALEEAREYCEKSGKQLETIRAIESGPGNYGKTSSAEIHFRCVTTATSK
jgi:sarcosine oxidase gamma subunit